MVYVVESDPAIFFRLNVRIHFTKFLYRTSGIRPARRLVNDPYRDPNTVQQRVRPQRRAGAWFWFSLPERRTLWKKRKKETGSRTGPRIHRSRHSRWTPPEARRNGRNEKILRTSEPKKTRTPYRKGIISSETRPISMMKPRCDGKGGGSQQKKIVYPEANDFCQSGRC